MDWRTRTSAPSISLATLATLAALAMLAAMPALAALESAEWDVDGLEPLLPRHETEAERLYWQGREHLMPGAGLTREDPPPLAPVRNCAEWEPCTGVVIRYPLGLPYNLLRDLDDDVTLHVVVSSGYQSQAQSNLENNGVDMEKVQFLVRNNDSIWTRDYGPWFVFGGNAEIAVIDHTYNRPYRPNDNMIPVYFAQQQGIPVHSHDMYHTGGNYMTDGAHISSSTQLVYNEAATYNGMSQAEVDQLMADYYGIETYQVLDYIESGGIHHIDTWAKFLDEETVLVKEVWSSHHTYNPLNQRATLLASLESSTGRPYEVHRVYCYNIGYNAPASYTNSLILNDKIYVPFFGNSSYDNDAVAAYQQAAPGYEVEGYYYSGFLSDDALHCRTKGAMDAQMLRVEHIPVAGEQTGPVLVTALVHAHSGTGVQAADLHYRQGGGDWNVLPMTAGGGDLYEATLPQPMAPATTDYYILASDYTGREEGMPRVAPAAHYSFAHVPDASSVENRPDAARVQMRGSYPNPFGHSTTLRFELLFADEIEVQVLDAQGRLVRTLVQGTREGGQHEIKWDGRDDLGQESPAGMYLFRLRAAGLQYSRPVVLIR